MQRNHFLKKFSPINKSKCTCIFLFSQCGGSQPEPGAALVAAVWGQAGLATFPSPSHRSWICKSVLEARLGARTTTFNMAASCSLILHRTNFAKKKLKDENLFKSIVVFSFYNSLHKLCSTCICWNKSSFMSFLGGQTQPHPLRSTMFISNSKSILFIATLKVTRLTVDRVKPLLTSNYTDYVPKMLYNDPK